MTGTECAADAIDENSLTHRAAGPVQGFDIDFHIQSWLGAQEIPGQDCRFEGPEPPCPIELRDELRSFLRGVLRLAFSDADVVFAYHHGVAQVGCGGGARLVRILKIEFRSEEILELFVEDGAPGMSVNLAGRQFVLEAKIDFNPEENLLGEIKVSRFQGVFGHAERVLLGYQTQAALAFAGRRRFLTA